MSIDKTVASTIHRAFCEEGTRSCPHFIAEQPEAQGSVLIQSVSARGRF